MKDFSFVDETIDLNRAHAYRLSIQVSLDGFSFSILDMVRGKFVVLKHYDLSQEYSYDEKGAKLRNILGGDTHLQPPFKQTLAMVATRKSTLLPSAYFQEDHLKKYLEYNHDMEEIEEIHYNHLQEINAYNIFSLPSPISNALIDHFGSVSYYHHGIPFLSYHLQNAPDHKKITGLSVYDHFIDIGIFSREKLHFYNTFQWSAHEDILYYLLYIYKQLELDVSTHELYVTGSTENQRELKKLIDGYIKKSHYQKPPGEFTYSYTFRKELANCYTNLFRLSLCV
jgi:hypothetical protein